jgi:hypothetical protein
MRVVQCLAVLLAAGALAGCGGTDRRAVSGTVTWKSRPLESGMIRFQPADPGGQTEAGAVITAGRYAIRRDQGLVPGKYKVTISTPDPASGRGPPDAPPGERGGYPARERIPARYNAKTDLTAEVTAGGKNEFEFQLD